MKTLLVITISLFFVLRSFQVEAQDSIAVGEISIPSVSLGCTFSPDNLAKALTEGISGDKEKFDAIFTWVASNISYNHRLFNSGKSNSSASRIKRTLRTRRGICTDYAELMDTLCELSGLECTTITGYTKEIIFDVNDSLFFDNHAWNAVRLDGYWYLFDATWSSGQTFYDYTKCGKRRIKWIKKLYSKAELVTVSMTTKKKGDKFCGIPTTKTSTTKEVMMLPFVPRVLIGLITIFKFRVVETHQKVSNLDYYLTLPEVFSVDHFPNNSIFSLQTEHRNVVDFSADSTYFYRADSLKRGNKRLGQKCIECDDYLALERIPLEKEIIKKSFQNNPKNHFVPASSDLTISYYFYLDVLAEEDSLAKMALIDSTLFYIKKSKSEFVESKRDNRKTNKFHKDKNRTKKKLLLKENKVHLYNSKKAFKNVLKRHIKIKSVNNKSKIYRKQNKKYFKKYNQYLYKKGPSRNLNEKREIKLRTDLAKADSDVDSLNLLIVAKRDNMLSHTRALWENVLDELGVLHPLVYEFYDDDDRRAFGLNDNYDHEIIEIRKTIREKENLFLSTVDSMVLKLSDTTYTEFIALNRLVKKRNIRQLKQARSLSSLRKGGAVSEAEIERRFDEKESLAKEDDCWNVDNRELFFSLEKNFAYFYKHHKLLYRAIVKNNRTETSRYNLISRYILTNYKRIYHAADQNRKLLDKIKKATYKHKGKYLKQLKKLQE